MTNNANKHKSTSTAWKNWSGFQESNPHTISQPSDIAQLSQIIRHSQKCRVVGAGHSFSPLVSTGTHGTGQNLTYLSGLVEGFQLMTANSDTLDCDRTQNTPIFEAGRVALGSLGVLTQIKMQNMPRYRLKEQIQLTPVQDILSNMDQWKTEHRHIECMVFIHARDAILKTLDPTDDEIKTLPAP